ncbi:MAG: hypothetical protein WB762_19825 [Candidatus Sulfotelmatobacter sp.]
MKRQFVTHLMVAALAVASISAQAATGTQSRTLVVQSPSDLPVLAQKDGEGMYLHNTGQGTTVLYVEAENGSKLIVLDVTDPAKIRRVSEVPLAASSAFDFVRSIRGDVLIRYRNGSGDALLSFKHYKQPQLVDATAFGSSEILETVGRSGLLLTTTNVAHDPVSDPQSYQLLDTASASGPRLLATIPGVTQCLSNPDTGTLFLLNDDGVTVIRRPRIEKQHETEILSQDN